MKNLNFWKGKHGPLLIAEIGGNHEGNFNYAKRLVKLAIATGVDAVKLQNIRLKFYIINIVSNDFFIWWN